MTPGPYRLDGLNIVGADGCVVATMNKPGGDLSSTAYADGRLFVAAPDLLAALTRLVVGVTGQSRPDCDHYDGITADALDEAEAALRAAQ